MTVLNKAITERSLDITSEIAEYTLTTTEYVIHNVLPTWINFAPNGIVRGCDALLITLDVAVVQFRLYASMIKIPKLNPMYVYTLSSMIDQWNEYDESNEVINAFKSANTIFRSLIDDFMKRTNKYVSEHHKRYTYECNEIYKLFSNIGTIICGELLGTASEKCKQLVKKFNKDIRKRFKVYNIEINSIMYDYHESAMNISKIYDNNDHQRKIVKSTVLPYKSDNNNSCPSNITNGKFVNLPFVRRYSTDADESESPTEKLIGTEVSSDDDQHKMAKSLPDEFDDNVFITNRRMKLFDDDDYEGVDWNDPK